MSVKFRFVVAVLILLGCWGGYGVVRASSERVAVFVNGLRYDVPAISRDGIDYFDVQIFSSAVGVPCNWDPRERKLMIAGRFIIGTVFLYKKRPFLPLNVLAQYGRFSYRVDDVRGIVEVKSNYRVDLNTTPKPPPPEPEPKPPGWDVPPDQMKTEQSTEERLEEYRRAGLSGSIWWEQHKKQAYALKPKTVAAVTPTEPPVTVQLAPHPWLQKEEQPIQRKSERKYVPRQASNALYRVVVNNLRQTRELKGTVPPTSAPDGYKFVVVYLSQENLTDASLDKGRFYLTDVRGTRFAFDTSLSLFPAGVLSAHQTCVGYLIAKVPQSTIPRALILSGTAAPLRVDL